MFCPKCGSSLLTGSKFCDRCGSRLVIDERVPPIISVSSAARSQALNENLVAQAQSRLKEDMEQNLREAESRLGELSKKLLNEAELKISGSVASTMNNLLTDSQQRLSAVAQSLAEANRLEATLQSYRRRIETELGVESRASPGTQPTQDVASGEIKAQSLVEQPRVPVLMPQRGSMAETVRNCPTCGVIVRPEAKFCQSCGTLLGGSTEIPRPAAPKSRARMMPMQGTVNRPFGVTLLGVLYLVGAILSVVSIASAYLLLRPIILQTVSLGLLSGLFDLAFLVVLAIAIVLVDVVFAYGLFKGVGIVRSVIRVLSLVAIIGVVIVVSSFAFANGAALSALGQLTGGVLVLYAVLAVMAIVAIIVPLVVFWYLGRSYVKRYFVNRTEAIAQPLMQRGPAVSR
jgi:predicted amidophosphoribosyltransferase